MEEKGIVQVIADKWFNLSEHIFMCNIFFPRENLVVYQVHVSVFARQTMYNNKHSTTTITQSNRHC